ncbi:MAG: 50S ribosomal protein L11 [Candidatus Heimdallarchaeota archaeon]|nr:50S ribosomal protein L11 [Candidatus Heimdallarchaeota archaeon]
MSDNTETVSLLIDAGEAKPSGSIAPALGPLGLNLGKVVADINEATLAFKGMKVPVNVIVNVNTRKYEIVVGLPPTSALVLNEIGIPKGSGTSNSGAPIANMKIDQLIKVAFAKRTDLLAATLGGACKEVLGTMVCMGITVENKDPREIQRLISDGKYDKELQTFEQSNSYN